MKLLKYLLLFNVLSFNFSLIFSVQTNLQSEVLSIENAVDYIKDNIENPQIITWYIGESGLKDCGGSFYKKIFNTFLSKELYHFYLYDLEAWKALRNSKASLFKPSAYSTKINDAGLKHFSSIGSESFFKYIKEGNSESLRSYVQNHILNKSFIYENSKAKGKNNLSVKGAFQEENTLVSSLNDLDTALAYSPLQYMEGIFLIKDLVAKALKVQSSRLNIVFLLPNDEAKYYKDSIATFHEHINTMLSLEEKLGNLSGLSDCAISINFIFFQYGDSICDRPYISREKSDKLIKPNKILDYIIE